MNSLFNWLDGQKIYGVLIVRIVLGVILISAGSGKLFGAGIPGVIDQFASGGLPGAMVLGTVVPLLEFFGGIAILLGVFTRLLCLLVFVQFAIIAIYIKPVLWGKDFNSLRIDMTLAAMALLIAFEGAGPFSLGDKISKGKRWAK